MEIVAQFTSFRPNNWKNGVIVKEIEIPPPTILGLLASVFNELKILMLQLQKD